MGKIEIYKFGGTSVGSAERMTAVAELVHGEGAWRSGLVVVASAMTRVTDALIDACALATSGDRDGAMAACDALLARHEAALIALATDEPAAPVRKGIEGLIGELRALLAASALLGELSPRTRDRIVSLGEKMSVRLLAVALRRRGVAARAMDADTFLETDDQFGEASPLSGVTDRTIEAALGPVIGSGCVPVVTGFCGLAPDGATTTLGRGGSDLSATVIAGALRAAKVTLWSDVDGVYSADPRVVPGARVIPRLNYREAAEMSYYGAKVLHQRTMIPIVDQGIPVWSRNSMRPEAAGTVVDGRSSPGSHPVKAISAVGGHCLMSVEGKGMAGVPGVAARVFGALAERRISVTMISQSSSEASICLAVPEGSARDAERALKRAFRAELTRGTIEDIVVQRGVSLLAAVGLGMAHCPGIAGRVFGALGAKGINVLAIAQGSSELNISVAVSEQDAGDAVRALHEGFGLHRLDTGSDAADGLDLMLIGCGKIGRALVELVLSRRAHVFERFGLRARVVAVSDRSGYAMAPAGLPLDELRTIFEAKAAGGAVAGQPGAVVGGTGADMVRAALAYRLARPVLVDVSDAGDSAAAFLAALERGCDVVTANKKPLAGPLADFEALMGAASGGRLIKAEATVGAGLPVVDTLEVLLATGDRLHGAEGCLSGTLGYLMARLEDGALFSEAVADAVSLGYTEPDPVADLSGADVGRKAIILGRLSGLVRSDAPIVLEGLVDPSWAGMGVDDLLNKIKILDDVWRDKVDAARARGEVWRYVARVSSGRIEVGPVCVAKGSAVGGLQGTDNMIVLRSERYDDRPLVVTGPGAGIEVTAMGVLGDILRIAAERRL